MKRSSTIIAILLILTMVLSMAGCGSSGGGAKEPTSAQALLDYANEKGATSYEDMGEFSDTLINASHKSGPETISGVISVAKDDLGTLEENGVYGVLGVEKGYESDMEQAAVYYVDGWLEEGSWRMIAIAFDFESEESAAAFNDAYREILEEMEEELKNGSILVGTYEGEDDNISYAAVKAIGEYVDIGVSAGTYLSGKSVLLIGGYESDSELASEAMTELCESFGIYDPSNIEVEKQSDGEAAETASDEEATAGNSYTLEDYFAEHPDDLEVFLEDAEGYTVEVKGNVLIFNFDMDFILSDGTTLEQAKAQADSDSIKESYATICAVLEEWSGLSGISVEMKYLDGDDEVFSKTYTADDYVEQE